ncbi:hypothetical protein ABZW18_02535 [Streptomyces sp. NPDC004647]|uniref:hypothetical protein n=1 Tax=Streptomyces sp. NPDC004647 TaxID=3154671 RepID=UPI0033AC4730
MAERNTGAGPEDGRDPVDEDAVWAAIVAGYGDEPADPDPLSNKDRDDDRVENNDENDENDEDADGGKGAGKAVNGEGDDVPEEPEAPASDPASTASPTGRPLGSSITVYSPGAGPRDWNSPAASEDDPDEGHFVPPEPPPLPSADTTAKFAWLAVLGGPLLLLLTVLLQWEMTWWIATLGIGGFLGGFATLVIRMRDDDDEDDDPGRGAVV